MIRYYFISYDITYDIITYQFQSILLHSDSAIYTVFTRSPHSGERGNAIVMYGCVCVCVSRSEPDALWPNPSSYSFGFWLI